MAIRNTSGLQLFVSNEGATVTTLTPTAVSASKPTVISVASVTGVTEGDFVSISGTDFEEIDGKDWIVGTVDGGANTFELVGSDTTGSVAVLGTTPVADLLPTTEFTKVCADSITPSSDAPSPIATPTFCDPTQSVPGIATAGATLDLGTYLETDSAGFVLLHDAYLSGDEHKVMVQFPGNGGWLIGAGTISQHTPDDIPIDGAVHFATQITLSSAMRHVF